MGEEENSGFFEGKRNLSPVIRGKFSDKIKNYAHHPSLLVMPSEKRLHCSSSAERMAVGGSLHCSKHPRR